MMFYHNSRKVFYFILKLFSPVFYFAYRHRLRVLAYHDVTDPVLFLKQVSYLQKKYNVISVDQLKAALIANKKLPKYSILITFDDGDYSVLEKGLPILEKFKFPAILFIITELIGTSKNFWWENVKKVYRTNKNSSKELRKKLCQLKNISNKKRVKELERFEIGTKKQLSIEDLKELNDHKILIANHSHSHPMFNKCTKEEICIELKNSSIFFKKLGFGDYGIFAYPNGNYDEESERLINKNNINLAFIFDHKINKRNIHPLRISRIRINSDTPMSEYISKVSGLHPFLYNLKHRNRYVCLPKN